MWQIHYDFKTMSFDQVIETEEHREREDLTAHMR